MILGLMMSLVILDCLEEVGWAMILANLVSEVAGSVVVESAY